MLEASEFHRGQGRHEDVFLARYGALRAWALRLTEGDAARAEDLVHDAFVQFTLARPDLGRVENLDGYLYQMLRNLNVSQMRRARRRREDAPAVVEYDSAEVALRASASSGGRRRGDSGPRPRASCRRPKSCSRTCAAASSTRAAARA